jgi:hypothetical protein
VAFKPLVSEPVTLNRFLALDFVVFILGIISPNLFKFNLLTFHEFAFAIIMFIFKFASANKRFYLPFFLRDNEHNHSFFLLVGMDSPCSSGSELNVTMEFVLALYR